jgi:hypothetical protein
MTICKPALAAYSFVVPAARNAAVEYRAAANHSACHHATQARASARVASMQYTDASDG